MPRLVGDGDKRRLDPAGRTVAMVDAVLDRPAAPIAHEALELCGDAGSIVRMSDRLPAGGVGGELLGRKAEDAGTGRRRVVQLRALGGEAEEHFGHRSEDAL